MNATATVDLHTHSTASDGTLAPAELVRAAREIQLAALAITDHDTVAGLPEALETGREIGMEVIPGCELSVKDDIGEIHIVGLYLPEHPDKLLSAMDELVRYRHDRNYIIVEKLNSAGVQITYDEIKALAGEGSVGRPHIAQILMRKGCVNSVQEAFDRYLGPNGKAYTPKKILTPEIAIQLLKEEGATVILAHPGMLPLGKTEQIKLVKTFIGFGLDGIEAYYGDYSPQQTSFYLQLANELNLLVSGGSDFHGSVKPNIRLGRGKNNLQMPYSTLKAIKDHRRNLGLPV